jgi:hypothetical protein
VLQAPIARLLALAIAVTLTGCGGKEHSAGTTPATATAPAPPAPSAAMPDAAPHPMPVAPAASVDLAGIAKAEGGRTVAEVFAAKAELAGQEVLVRGRVVKSNPNVMGKNWLHVRDGSGGEGTNDLTVTTTGAAPQVGDTVLVKGTVALDRDLGMGYRYEVIVEDAEVTIEATGS